MKLLHPALAQLSRMRLRARGRTMVRGLGQPSKLVFFVAGVIIVALWVLPSVAAAFAGNRSNPETVRETAPLFLFAMCLMSLISNADERAIYFSPGEVDLLFTGPFTRRQLLAFKLAMACVGMFLSALLLSCIMLRHVTFWVAGFTGIFLGLWFVHLLNMAVIMIGQTVAEGAYTRTRKLLLAAVLVAVLVAASQAFNTTQNTTFLEALQRMRHSAALRYLCAPFGVYAQVLAAESLFPEMLGWALVGIAMNLGLIAVVMKLDANYLEAAADISQRHYARFLQRRQGGFATGNVASKTVRWRFPPPPRIKGAGPILWRQIINALRNARGLLIVIAVICVVAGPMFATMSGESSQWAIVIFVGIWLTVMLSMMIRFDFRTDIETMEWLKMLPVTPTAVVVGELLTPVLLTTFIQLVVVGSVALRQGKPLVLIAVAAFVLPVNTLLYGLENLFFLLWPTKAVAANPGDLQFFGRQMLTMLAKLILLAICCGAACLAGVVAWLAAGKHLIPAAVVAWMCITAQAIAMMPLIALAFRRFDLSLDNPTE